jgi:hypothetical protein
MKTRANAFAWGFVAGAAALRIYQAERDARLLIRAIDARNRGMAGIARAASGH